MERKEEPAGPVGQFMRRNGPFSTSLKLILPFFLISVSEVLNWTGHPVVRAEGRSLNRSISTCDASFNSPSSN